jgi:hypothetical protein
MLIYLLEQRPFSKKTLSSYNLPDDVIENKNSINKKNFVVTPRLLSKFSPVTTIGKSPGMKKKEMLTSRGDELKSKNFLMGFGKKDNIEKIIEEEKHDTKEKEKDKIPVKRKLLTNIQKNLTETINEDLKSRNNYEDLPITDAILIDGKTKNKSVKDESEISEKNEIEENWDEVEEETYEGNFYCRINPYDDTKYEVLFFRLFKKDLCCKYIFYNFQVIVQKSLRKLSQ